MKGSIIFLSILLIVSSLAYADVPETLSYQGVLTDAGGAVVPDGTYNVTFRLYEVPSGGSAIWQETQPVTVSKGIFNAELGTLTSLSGLNFENTYYLGISVEGAAELTPRIKLNSVPYSMNSRQVFGSGNVFPSSGNVGIGTLTPSYNLHISDNANNIIGIRLENASTEASAIEGITFSGGGAGGLTGIYAYGPNAVYRNALNIFNSRSEGYIQFRTNGLERMRIANNGHVGIGIMNPAEMLDVAGGVRVGNSSNTNAGTIRWTGTDFEGYDGSSWRSLTGGGGTLPSGSAGATLRHNGSIWVASYNIYNTGSRVGIGTTTPDAPLDIMGGNWDLDNTDGDLKIGNDTYKLKIGVATGGGGAGTAGIRMQGGAQKLILGAGSKEAMTIDSTGAVNIGTESMSGTLYHYLGNGAHGLQMYDFLGIGSAINMYDEEGNLTFVLEPDISGTGGFFAIYRNSSSQGFYVDGNSLGSENTKVYIGGSDRSAVFDMNSSGDNSVQLPASSISSAEILDEPGGASSVAADATYITLTTDVYTTITSRTITVPSAGYVYVIASAQVNVTHTTGTYSRGVFGVSQTNTTFEHSTDIDVYFSSSSPSASYRIPLTSQALFPVASSGSYTYYFLGYEDSGSYSVGDVRLTLIFIPTAYGTVSSPAKPASTNEEGKVSVPGLTNADIEAERAESIRFNMERIQRELDAMKRQMEEMEKSSGNNR